MVVGVAVRWFGTQHPGVPAPFVGDIPDVFSHSESGWTFPTPGCMCGQVVVVVERMAVCVSVL